MEIKQIHAVVQDALKEALGETALLNEDLSNVVSMGDTLTNANAYETYVRALVNRIGKTIFVDRQYKGRAPKVLMDSWEYGSIAQKISGDLPNVITIDESWDLQDGSSYDPNVFNAPNGIKAKVFNGLTTFEIDRSIVDRQLKQSFTSAYEMNRFIEMLFTLVNNALTLATEQLIMRTINNMIGVTFKQEYAGAEANTKSGVRAINLLYKYNQEYGTSMTKEVAIKNADFLKFASAEIGVDISHLQNYSTLFNNGGAQRFTPKDELHVVMLDTFVKYTATYLQADTFNKDLLALPNAEEIGYWQGSGTSFAIGDTSKINIKTSKGDNVQLDYIIGCAFDRNCLGVSLFDRRVKTHYNEKGEFTNYFYKQEARYFSDENENFIFWYLA